MSDKHLTYFSFDLEETLNLSKMSCWLYLLAFATQMLGNSYRTSVTYDNEHLFSSWVCGFCTSQLVQAGPCQVTVPPVLHPLWRRGPILLVGVAEAQESKSRGSGALQTSGHATPTNISLTKANLAKLKVKV